MAQIVELISMEPSSMIPFSNMQNPFYFGRELGIGSLVDRKQEVGAVKQAIRDGNKLFLIGPRRFGKTSILKTAADELTQKESAIVVRLDAESFPSLDLLVAAIVAAAAKSMRGEPSTIRVLVKKAFSMLRVEADYSLIDGEWSVRLGLEPERLSNPTLVVDALNGFEKLAKLQSADKPVGLILDEFQRVIEIGGRAIEGQIRSAIQTHSRTGYVFAGSKTRMLYTMLMDAARPFYRLGSNIFVGPVPRKDFDAFLKGSFIRSGIRVEADATEEILNLAANVPYNVQRLANQCWADIKESGSRKPILSKPAVRNALELVVRQDDPFYATLWNSLTSIQQRTLMAVVVENGSNMQANRVVQSIGKSAGTIRKALHGMMEMTILREEQDVAEKAYRFEDPFFACWIQLATRG